MNSFSGRARNISVEGYAEGGNLSETVHSHALTCVLSSKRRRTVHRSAAESTKLQAGCCTRCCSRNLNLCAIAKLPEARA